MVRIMIKPYMSNLDTIINALEDMKAEAITLVDVKKSTTITDYMLFVTGLNVRHNRSMMQMLIELSSKCEHLSKAKIEGDDNCQWILVNFGDIVVHLMTAETRSYYAIDQFWQQQAQNSSAV